MKGFMNDIKKLGLVAGFLLIALLGKFVGPKVCKITPEGNACKKVLPSNKK